MIGYVKGAIMKDIGSIISENRKRLKMTQQALSDRLAQNGINISFKTISGWEKGLTEPSIAAFVETCRILGIPDIYEVLYGENPFDISTNIFNLILQLLRLNNIFIGIPDRKAFV